MIPLVAKTRIGGMSAGASSALEKGQVLAEKGKKNDKTGSGNRTTMASVDIEVLRLIGHVAMPLFADKLPRSWHVFRGKWRHFRGKPPFPPSPAIPLDLRIGEYSRHSPNFLGNDPT